jgi:hypothetical protein
MKADTQTKLKALLGQLPTKQAGTLVSAFEHDRVAGGNLPYGMMIDALRPALRQMRAPRRGATPLRLFCEPFEDILFSGARTRKLVGRVPRSSIAPIWDWLATELMSETLDAFCNQLVKEILEGDKKIYANSAAAFHQSAAIAIKNAFDQVDPDGEEYRHIANTLGSFEIAKDAEEIGAALAAAPYLLRIQKKFPRAIEDLSDEDLTFIRDTYDRVAEELPDQARYVALCVMGRLARPWEVLRVIAILSRAPDDTKIVNTDLGEVGNLVFTEIESLADEIRTARVTNSEVTQLLGVLSRFVEISKGVTRQMGLRKEGPWGQRLFKSRAKVASALEHQMERAPDYVMGAFPLIFSGASSGTGVYRPDLTRMPDEERVVEASNVAVFLDSARALAKDAAFGRAHKSAVEAVERFLLAYSEDIVTEVRAANDGTLSELQAHLETTLRIMALAVGEEEADLLRRRVVAAAQ